MNKLLEILPDLYDAAIDPSLWTKNLDAMASLLGAKTAGLVSFEMVMTTNSYTVQKASSAWTDEMLEYYQKHLAIYDSPIFPVVASSEPGIPTFDSDLLNNRVAFDVRPDTQYMLEKIGTYEKFGVRVTADPVRLDCAVFQYDKSRGNITQSERKVLGQLWPHVGQAVQHSKTFSRLKQHYQAVIASLDRVNVAIFLVSADGGIVLKNRRAQRMIEESPAISQSLSGQLVLSSASSNAQLHQAIDRASKTAVGEGNLSAQQLIVQKPGSEDRVIVDISPVRDTEDEMGEQYRGAIVSIIDPDYDAALDVSCLKTVYGLSKAEQSVAQLIVQGCNHKEIADIRSVSVETIKSQATSVLRKTNTRSRSSLVHRVLSILLPIDLADE